MRPRFLKTYHTPNDMVAKKAASVTKADLALARLAASASAVVASEDGNEIIKEQIVSSFDNVKENGRILADQVLNNGGKKILEQLNLND